MVLWSLTPALTATLLFFWTVFFPPKPMAERQGIRWWVVGLTLLVLLPSLFASLLHLFVAQEAWMPRELS